MGYVFMLLGAYLFVISQLAKTHRLLDGFLYKVIPALIGIFLFVAGAADVGLLEAMRAAV